MLLIDSHAHIDSDDFKNDFDQVLKRAAEAEVGYIINIAIDRQSILNSLKLIDQYPQIYCALGIHPHEADKYSPEDTKLVETLLSHPKVVAVGEVGLDFYRHYAGHNNQRRLFRTMIELAKRYSKPLVIHNRAAAENTLQILREEGAAKLGGVFHCFPGGLDLAKQVLSLGFHISFAGPLTYPKSSLPETADYVPMERILLETDCPYLPPQSWRGKRNEPAFIRETAQKLAQVKGLTLEDIARSTSVNCHRLFSLGPAPLPTIAYPIRNSLYLNLTNRCTCDCVFCPRLKRPMVQGHNLKLEQEPSFQEVVQAVDRFSRTFEELVFCGYGEPTLRFELVKELARHYQRRFPRIRLDTNGQGSLINRRDIVPELMGLINAVSVSLNAASAQEYIRLNRPQYGERAFEGMLDFMRKCLTAGLEVTASIVGFPGADIEGTKEIARLLGVKYRIRKYNDLGGQ